MKSNRLCHTSSQIWLIFGMQACIHVRNLRTKIEVKTPCRSWDWDAWYQAFFWLLPSAAWEKFATECHSFLTNFWSGWAVKLTFGAWLFLKVRNSKMIKCFVQSIQKFENVLYSFFDFEVSSENFSKNHHFGSEWIY